MALINKAVNEITVKLVYYGPGLCGKTTNLERIFADPKLGGKGKMLSVATETDRTLFFDFMPLEVGTIRGQKVRVQLYTVPGQVFYDATRRLVLRGADGVVFVADSQRAVADSNLESYRNLRDNLVINRLDPDRIPLVFQYNKRDLKDVLSTDELDGILNPEKKYPAFPAVAIASQGVTQTLQKAIALILTSVAKGTDLTLPDEVAAAPRPSVHRVAPPPVTPPAPAVLPAGDGQLAAIPVAARAVEASADEEPFGASPGTGFTSFVGGSGTAGIVDETPFPDEPATARDSAGTEFPPGADVAPFPEPRASVADFGSSVPTVPSFGAGSEPAADPEPNRTASPTMAPLAAVTPTIPPEVFRAVVQGTEQTIELLQSIIRDLEQQRTALRRYLGEN